MLRDIGPPISLQTQSPDHQAGLGGRYKLREFSTSLNVYYMSNTVQRGELDNQYFPVGSRLIINAQIAYSFHGAGQWDVVLNGTNLGDIRFGRGFHKDVAIKDVERIGSRVWLELRWHNSFL